ncbi:MAG TPA: orotidine-5'-phosphate decarboxylase, partial [Rhizomicrobium sp.]
MIAARTSNPVFVALDTTDLDYARVLAKRVRGHVGGLKLGLEFFSAHGPGGVKPFVEMGLPVFLDLKYHDIPNTVAGACRAAASLGVSIMNVHAQGGAAMMRAAVEAAKAVSPSTRVIAVTMLTSLGDEDLPSLGLKPPVADSVLRLASLTQQCGLDGV